MLMATQTNLKLIARHGACLYSAWDGSLVHYGEVVAAQVVTTDRIRDFLLSVNGIETEAQLMNRGSRKPLRVCTVSNDYANATDKQRKNNTFEYKSCKYLLRLKVTTNHCRYD